MNEEEKSALRNLSTYLEKTIETVIENQRLLIAIHKSLADQNQEFEETCKRYLDNPPLDIQPTLNQMKGWESQAKKALLALRKL